MSGTHCQRCGAIRDSAFNCTRGCDSSAIYMPPSAESVIAKKLAQIEQLTKERDALKYEVDKQVLHSTCLRGYLLDVVELTNKDSQAGRVARAGLHAAPKVEKLSTLLDVVGTVVNKKSLELSEKYGEEFDAHMDWSNWLLSKAYREWKGE